MYVFAGYKKGEKNTTIRRTKEWVNKLENNHKSDQKQVSIWEVQIQNVLYKIQYRFFLSFSFQVKTTLFAVQNSRAETWFVKIWKNKIAGRYIQNKQDLVFQDHFNFLRPYHFFQGQCHLCHVFMLCLISLHLILILRTLAYLDARGQKSGM